jgi:hypothetical protein
MVKWIGEQLAEPGRILLEMMLWDLEPCVLDLEKSIRMKKPRGEAKVDSQER